MFWDCIEFLRQKRRGAVLVESTHKEGHTNKQELYQRKRNDKELITYTQYLTDPIGGTTF